MKFLKVAKKKRQLEVNGSERANGRTKERGGEKLKKRRKGLRTFWPFISFTFFFFACFLISRSSWLGC